MINRKRYYNSFFDQINEYKQNKHPTHQSSNFIHEHTLAAGLLASGLIVALFGGFNSLAVPGFFGGERVALVRTESRPAFNFVSNLQEADDSFASEPDGSFVIPSQDAHSDVRNRRANFGFDSVLYAGGAPQARSFLSFDVTSLDSREDLVLKLYPVTSFSGTIVVSAGSADELWEEDTLTAESMPTVSGRELARSSGTFNPGVSVDFDLRDAFVENNPSLVVTATGGVEGFSFYSREGIRPPELRTVR